MGNTNSHTYFSQGVLSLIKTTDGEQTFVLTDFNNNEHKITETTNIQQIANNVPVQFRFRTNANTIEMSEYEVSDGSYLGIMKITSRFSDIIIVPFVLDTKNYIIDFNEIRIK